ncbi:MAG: response regulator, partial [Chloroflexota bacterium]
MRAIIADDHALFRDGLASLLEARGVEIVAEAQNGEEAVAFAEELKPDVVLMDLKMPKMDGLTATRLIKAKQEDIHVVVVTASDDDADLFEAIKSGAEGYILKNLESEEFFELLQGVTRGEPALTPALARRVLREFASDQGESQEPAEELTDRERDVLELLVQG